MFGEMTPKEDKARICKELLKVLRMTRDQQGLIELRYENGGSYGETVVATYRSGGRQEINVTMDSGIALIRDVVRALR